MAASFSFELRKLRKRPATWVLAALVVLVVLVFDYYQFYSAIRSLESGGEDVTRQITDVQEFREFLLPASVTVNVAGLLAQFGGPISLILGALAAGSEYGWRTLGTILTQRPGRLSVLLGKLLAVGVTILALSLLALAAGAAGSYTAARLFEEPVVWPSAGNVALAVGEIWLILAAWASLGIVLAVLSRGTALAIGLGLVYGLAIEGLVLGFSGQSRVIEAFTNVLLTGNSNVLSGTLGDNPQAFTAPDPVDPAQAVLVLGGYVVVSLLISALVFRRQDVT